MQAWMFDRSGSYSSTAFDIHKEPERFISTIAAYVMLSDEELGLDTFVERDNGDRFITVVEDATGNQRRFQMEPFPITRQRAIVYRGTSCFRARTPSSENFQYVAKFSWVSDMRRSEAELLRWARERGVKGAAKLFGQGDSVVNLPGKRSRSLSGLDRADGRGSDWVFDVFAEDDCGTEGDGLPPSKRARSSPPPLEAAENRSSPAATVAVEGVQAW